ncbi:MAG: hypothetical protein GY909_12285 [Oligoflexia bacterium]|nr:hypothetical protein [Oligoflexia bacterium]
MFISLNEYEKCHLYIEELLLEKEISDFIDHAINFYLDIGRISDAKKCIELKINSLMDKRIYQKVLKTLEENEELISSHRRSELLLEIYISIGDYNRVHEVGNISAEKLLAELSSKGSYWLKTRDNIECILEKFKELNFKTLNNFDRRLFINTVLDKFLTSDEMDFEQIAKYAIVNRNKGLAKSILPFFSNKELVSIAGKYNGKKEATKEDTGHIDELEEIKVLERNLKFLQKKPGENSSKIKEIIERLREIDPSNILLQDKRTENTEIYEDLRKELEKYSLTELDKDTAHLTARHLTKIDDFKNKYESIIANLMFEEDFSVCIEFINICLKNESNIEKQINLNYLKAEALYKRESFFELKDLLEEAFEKWPMLKDEKLNLRYLYAEAMLMTGHKEDAYSLYKFIAKKNNNYRLTNVRIEEIEGNK